MIFSDIKTAVEERIDRRSISDERHARWANMVRKEIASDFEVAGFRGLYFLYKEATVIDGTIAGQPKYEIPDDFIDDLNVFVDGILLAKSPAGILDIVQDVTDPDAGTPGWVQMKGSYFEIIPPADEDGLELKLFYNAYPEEIQNTDNDNFQDYFLKNWPNVHTYGMLLHAVEGYAGLGASQGARQALGWFERQFQKERKLLALHNRRFYYKNARIRVQNWDEFEEKKKYVFPQYQET